MKLTLQTQLLPDAEAGESSGDTILNFSELGMVFPELPASCTISVST